MLKGLPQLEIHSKQPRVVNQEAHLLDKEITLQPTVGMLGPITNKRNKICVRHGLACDECKILMSS